MADLIHGNRCQGSVRGAAECEHDPVGDRAEAEALVEGVTGGVGEVGEEHYNTGPAVQSSPGGRGCHRGAKTAPTEIWGRIDGADPGLPADHLGTPGQRDRAARV